jgi:hypothetical protein
MGSGHSGPSYRSEVKKNAERLGLGLETMDAIYDRFLEASKSNQEYIPKNAFLQLFPFTTKMACDNILTYCNVKDKGCSVEGFAKLFAALDPKYDSAALSNLLFEIFKTDTDLFDLATFMTELKSNLLFTCEGSSHGLNNYITSNIGRESTDKISTLTRKEFYEITKERSSYVLLYGKQLVFGSYIFQ